MGKKPSIDALAARQHGVFNRRHAITNGFTYDQIRTRLASGEWIAIDVNVFALRSAPATWHRQLQAAILSRPVALAAGRSAGVLHGFSGFSHTRPEILVPFPGNARSPIARVIRSRHFERISTATVQGFPATSVAETIFTLSLTESAALLERVIDDQLAAKQLRIPDFDPIFERLENARLRNLPSLRRIVADRDRKAYQPPTTELERLLYQMLDRPELPDYERQLPIQYERLAATVDAFIPPWRIIVEGDGRRWHTRRADFERDRRRDNLAAAAGFLVVRFSYRMLHDDPDACFQTLIDSGSWRQSA